ncbi:G-protein coupled receptor 4 [Anabarilius grahami]|uniref:G-protein coupled receptor 4 n=1 Tax=Anabarilius grahami TaxID=495550 RepID=A0A3N0XSQ5_ANAGA|nr:G-protein coupled receptor 4 [Anabarilius grahami]
MNISREIFPTDGSNSSSYLFNIGTDIEINLLYFLSVVLGLPTNSYVIWLIVSGKRNELAAKFFSLNLAVCEILLCVEIVLIFLSYEFEFLWTAVSAFDGLAFIGHPQFLCLICFERYLAVVHPVTFLKFKPLRYRVICSVIVWVASFGFGGIFIFFTMFQPMFYLVFLFTQFFFFLCIQLFCLVAVLRALKQSGPGERGREEENHMKSRAFYLILITTVTMLIAYAPYLILLALFMTTGSTDTLLSIISCLCFSLAGFVQPLLFLYRMRKLPFIKYQ